MGINPSTFSYNLSVMIVSDSESESDVSVVVSSKYVLSRSDKRYDLSNRVLPVISSNTRHPSDQISVGYENPICSSDSGDW